MIAILVVTNAALAYALRHHSNHEYTTKIRNMLNESGASIHPLHTAWRNDDGDRYFRIQVSSGGRDALVHDLRSLPGVEGAYVKPAASPA